MPTFEFRKHFVQSNMHPCDPWLMMFSIQHKTEEGWVNLFWIQTSIGHCCAANTIVMLHSWWGCEDVHAKARVAAAFQWLTEQSKLHPNGAWDLKDFFFFCGEHQTGFYRNIIQQPECTEILRFDSRSEPGHQVIQFHIKL